MKWHVADSRSLHGLFFAEGERWKLFSLIIASWPVNNSFKDHAALASHEIMYYSNEPPTRFVRLMGKDDCFMKKQKRPNRLSTRTTTSRELSLRTCLWFLVQESCPSMVFVEKLSSKSGPIWLESEGESRKFDEIDWGFIDGRERTASNRLSKRPAAWKTRLILSSLSQIPPQTLSPYFLVTTYLVWRLCTSQLLAGWLVTPSKLQTDRPTEKNLPCDESKREGRRDKTENYYGTRAQFRFTPLTPTILSFTL